MSTFTLIHVIISLIAIVSGLVVVLGLLTSNRMNALTAVFLGTTALTCVTGFFFPFHGLKPSYIVGVLTLLLTGLAYGARYCHQFNGSWRWIYVVSTTIALYFNVFVLIVQSFLKIPSLTALAPTQTEPPFKIAQGVALLLFILLGALGVKTFHPQNA